MGLRGRKPSARRARRAPQAEGPLLLAVDTSGAWLNVALQRGPQLLGQHSALQQQAHAGALLPVVETLLTTQGLALADLAALGVCLGPGSFTGLRVSMTTVKALSFSAGLPAVGVTAPEVLAMAPAWAASPVGCLIDARQGGVYSALYSAPDEDGGRDLLLPAAAGSPEEAAQRLAAATPELCLVGSACEVFRERLSAAAGEGAYFAPPAYHSLQPAVLAARCMAAFEAGRGGDANLLEPAYVGKPPIHKRRDRA